VARFAETALVTGITGITGRRSVGDVSVHHFVAAYSGPSRPRHPADPCTVHAPDTRGAPDASIATAP
jgi:hypothetical protein